MIDEERLRRIQQFLAMQQPRETQPPLAAGTDEVQQARQLEQQASPRQERPTGLLGQLGRSVLEGAAGLAHPGGYYGWQADRQATERQRQQDLLSRAQTLRQQATQGQNAELAGRRLDLEARGQESEDEYRRAQIEKLRQPEANYTFEAGGPGQPYGPFNKLTGKFEQMGTTPMNERPATETEQDYVDYLRHPELTGKYGNDRVGFRKYQAAEGQQRSINIYGATTAQNPSILWGDDPEHPGNQAPYRYNKATDSVDQIGITKTPTSAADREIGTQNSRKFIAELKKISQRLITNPNALQQRIEAIKRGGEAALAGDPDYRVYQDLRTSLAAALAVREQGKRVSDYDVRGIYLPAIPDIFRDNTDSADIKWKLMEMRMEDPPKDSGKDGVPPPPPGAILDK